MKTINVGARIKEIRESKGITQTFMARKMGYKAVSSYARIEDGTTNITLEQALKISELLGVSINDFLFEENLRETRITSA